MAEQWFVVGNRPFSPSPYNNHPPHQPCSSGGDSSALSCQTLLSDPFIVFASESRGPRFKPWNIYLALHWRQGCREKIHAVICVKCVDKSLITDYGVFCGINAGLFGME